MYWEKVPEQIVLKITPIPEAEDRVREGILLHLTPESKSFKFQLTLPPGKGPAAGKIKISINKFLRK